MEEGFIEMLCLKPLWVQYGFMCSNALPELSETNRVLAQRSVGEKAMGPAARFPEKTSRRFAH
jgi:hypothetical protein